MTQDMYTRTLNLLKEDEGTIPEIASGADVNVHWLAKFRQERFANPGVKTIERLHNYLQQRAHLREHANECVKGEQINAHDNVHGVVAS